MTFRHKYSYLLVPPPAPVSATEIRHLRGLRAKSARAFSSIGCTKFACTPQLANCTKVYSSWKFFVIPCRKKTHLQ